MPTIKDVAREAGVSIATVSYVLNNKSASISEATRQLVIETAERIGYTPNVTARNLRFSRTNLIGYAWHEVPLSRVNPVLDRFTYYLAHAAEEAGYHVLTFTHPEKDPIPAYQELMRMRRLDGFVLSESQLNDPRVSMLLEEDFPFVIFGRTTTPDDRIAWADVDGESGVAMAIKHLVELGHRRIGIVGWDNQTTVNYFRLKGFRSAMTRAGLPVPADYIILGDRGEAAGRQALRRWMTLPKRERPTAVLTASDFEAIGVMREAELNGLTIGDTLSVIGFDDMPLSEHLHPSLTTLSQPIPEAASIVMDMLHNIINNQQLKQSQHLLAPELIVRASCGPAPAE